MIKLVDLLKEIADSPYTLSAPTKTQQGKFIFYVDYYFTTDNKREYYVRFSSEWKGRSKQPDQKYNWATELTFFPKGNRLVGEPTNVGDENFGKILATISKALTEYIKKYKPEYVFWKGIKDEKETNPGVTKRQRIYNVLLGREAQNIPGYKATIGDKLSSIEYEGEIPIPSAKEFKYPETPSYYDEEKAKQKVSRFNLAR
jgi:hypothetical protein